MHTDQIYIAMDGKSGMHVLVRILAVDDIGVDYPPIDPDNFNKLMMARDVKSLVLAARDLGPMYISADILSRRTFIPSHLQQDIECGFNLIPPNLESLLSECYFDPYAIPDEIAGMGYRAIGRTGKKANGAGDNASGGNGSGGGNNAGGENKGDENSGSQLQAPTVSVTGMDVVGERVTAKVSNLPEGATRVSYQWQYSPTKTGTFSDIEYGGNKNSYEISEEDEYYYLRCKVTTSSSKGKVPDAYSETIGEVYVFDWSKYPTGSYRPRFNGNSLACCAAPYNSSTQIPSLGEGDYASIVFDNELSDIPQGNITYRWFKCFGLGNGAAGVVKELGSSPSLSLSGLQGSYINCEVTLTVNGKSKTFVPKAICNGKVSDGIYVRPRIG